MALNTKKGHSAYSKKDYQSCFDLLWSIFRDYPEHNKISNIFEPSIKLDPSPSPKNS